MDNNNEIMETEVIEEATQEIADTGFGPKTKIGAGIIVAALVGGLTYKFVVKPMIAKIKAKKIQEAVPECESSDEESENDCDPE